MVDETPTFHSYSSERLDWGQQGRAAAHCQQAAREVEREAESAGHWPHHDQLAQCVGQFGDFLGVALR